VAGCGLLLQVVARPDVELITALIPAMLAFASLPVAH
jgi:hypothetical protein